MLTFETPNGTPVAIRATRIITFTSLGDEGTRITFEAGDSPYEMVVGDSFEDVLEAIDSESRA